MKPPPIAIVPHVPTSHHIVRVVMRHLGFPFWIPQQGSVYIKIYQPISTNILLIPRVIFPPRGAAFDSSSPVYPVPTGKAAILPTIALNSRRVRRLSASSSQ